MTVEAVNLADRLALLSDGRTVPVTVMYCAGGDETDDPATAVTCVCGSGEQWFAVRLGDFDPATTH